MAVVRAEAVAYMRALAGRDDEVALELVSGQASALTPSARPESSSDRRGYAFDCCKALRQISTHANCTNPNRMSARRS